MGQESSGRAPSAALSLLVVSIAVLGIAVVLLLLDGVLRAGLAAALAVVAVTAATYSVTSANRDRGGE